MVRIIPNQSYICKSKKFVVEKKLQLIEKLGVYLEHKEQLAPLAARIIATLILKGKKGSTFESLVCDLNASKSTIFTHLSNLQHSQRISYYTKPGDRKKYFILSPDTFLNSMDTMIENWEKERELHIEVMEYKKEINESLAPDSDDHFDLDFHTAYIDYLEQIKKLMKSFRQKIIENNAHE